MKIQKQLEIFLESLKNEDPLVSVIVPCYKQASLLSESLDSVLAQDYGNFEIIVVNDGSPDETSSVTASFIQANPGRKIRLIEKTNGGPADARNAGLRAAKGMIVMCLDADDKLRPRYLSTGIGLMRAQSANLFYSNQENFGAEQRVWDPGTYSPYSIRYSNCISNAAMYDRAIFEQSGGYRVAFSFGEDWDYWVSCSRQGIEVCKSEEALYQYRVHKEGLAEAYIRGHYKDCMNMVVLANEDLYPVEEVLAAQEHVRAMAPAAHRKIADLDVLHREEWLLKFLLGLMAENNGKSSEAMKLYWLAVDLTENRNWQPFYRLAGIFEKAAQSAEAIRFYRLVHTLRPDMSRFVLPKIVTLAKGQPV